MGRYKKDAGVVAVAMLWSPMLLMLLLLRCCCCCCSFSTRLWLLLLLRGKLSLAYAKDARAPHIHVAAADFWFFATSWQTGATVDDFAILTQFGASLRKICLTLL